MPLSAGDKLGPYEMTGAIVAGGMSEVDNTSDTLRERASARKASLGHLIIGPAYGKHKQVDLPGAPFPSCAIASARGGSWASDGNFFTDADGGSGLSRIPSCGRASCYDANIDRHYLPAANGAGHLEYPLQRTLFALPCEFGSDVHFIRRFLPE